MAERSVCTARPSEAEMLVTMPGRSLTKVNELPTKRMLVVAAGSTAAAAAAAAAAATASSSSSSGDGEGVLLMGMGDVMGQFVNPVKEQWWSG